MSGKSLMPTQSTGNLRWRVRDPFPGFEPQLQSVHIVSTLISHNIKSILMLRWAVAVVALAP